jgi:hypothetical protein
LQLSRREHCENTWCARNVKKDAIDGVTSLAARLSTRLEQAATARRSCHLRQGHADRLHLQRLQSARGRWETWALKESVRRCKGSCHSKQEEVEGHHESSFSSWVFLGGPTGAQMLACQLSSCDATPTRGDAAITVSCPSQQSSGQTCEILVKSSDFCRITLFSMFGNFCGVRC